MVYDKLYVLADQPGVKLENEQSLWTRIGDQHSLTRFDFEALNVGYEHETITVEVAATWKSRSSGGGGPTTEDRIEGLATGTAYTRRHVFTWVYGQRLQFADGESHIRFMVSTAEEGAFADQGDYRVRGREGWEITQVANGNISGTVRSHSAGKGQLEIHYKNILQNTSPDEIAFANFDLVIAKFGNTGHLTEDRLPQNQVAAPPHEMNPGGIVIAPPAGSNSPPMRTRLTITGNRPAIAGGSYTLSAANALTKLRWRCPIRWRVC
ncbi:MAG: hypothetical protein RL346_1053, partial [Verrucomicrobiota bacterium]